MNELNKKENTLDQYPKYIQLIDFIWKVIDDSNVYTNEESVIEEFKDKIFSEVSIKQIKEVIDKYSRGFKNHCTECNIDIGESNPRQLCCKTYCSGIYRE